MISMLLVSLPQQKAEPRDAPERCLVTPFEHLYANLAEIITILLQEKINHAPAILCWMLSLRTSKDLISVYLYYD